MTLRLGILDPDDKTEMEEGNEDNEGDEPLPMRIGVSISTLKLIRHRGAKMALKCGLFAKTPSGKIGCYGLVSVSAVSVYLMRVNCQCLVKDIKPGVSL